MVQVPQTRSFAGGIAEPIEGRKNADDFAPFRGKSRDRQSKADQGVDRAKPDRSGAISGLFE
jgi:hypothetical protein